MAVCGTLFSLNYLLIGYDGGITASFSFFSFFIGIYSEWDTKEILLFYYFCSLYIFIWSLNYDVWLKLCYFSSINNFFYTFS